MLTLLRTILVATELKPRLILVLSELKPREHETELKPLDIDVLIVDIPLPPTTELKPRLMLVLIVLKPSLQAIELRPFCISINRELTPVIPGGSEYIDVLNELKKLTIFVDKDERPGAEL